MPEATPASKERPSSGTLCNMELDSVEQLLPAKDENKTGPRQASEEYGSEFTFHPRVSKTSSRIVENMGMDFLERQQRHMDKQKKMYQENQMLRHQICPTSKHSESKVKMSSGHVQNGVLSARPYTGDRSLIQKRHRTNANKLKQRTDFNEAEKMEADSSQSPIPFKSAHPSLPPRAKTYYATVSQSLTSSSIYGSTTVRKRRANDAYANFDRLQRAKVIAEKAIKFKKIFSIHGPYPLIRKALRERGWVEKEFKLPLRAKSNKQGDSDVDDQDDDDDFCDDVYDNKESGMGVSPRPPFDANENEKEKENDDCYGIMGRMVRNELPTFQWTTRTSSIDWRFLQKDQIVNHFSKANFTTKVGLGINLRMLSCFTEGHSDCFFPRCYRLGNEEEKMDFIDDFRLTAAVSILKITVTRHIDDSYGQENEKMENGQLAPIGGAHIVPNSVLLLAIRACSLYADERDHDDIDQDECVYHIPNESWDQLLFHYTKLAHDGAVIAHSGSYFKQCEQALDKIKALNPQYHIDGVKNTWIIKPGAKSRGRGIMVMNSSEEILKLVSGDPNLIKDSRWVVQKYIERPLLIHATKFDIRQWFLVSDWNPLVIWIYKESYLRFSSRPFSLKNLEPSIHLCNYSVQKNFETESTRHSMLPPDKMWSDADFKNYLKSRGCHTLWDDLIFPGIKKSIVHVCQTALDTVEYRKGSFELYGADFMIDENYNPWLIEVNSSPTMSRSTAVTNRLCTAVQEDIIKVVLDRKKDKNCDIGMFELIHRQSIVDVPLYVGKELNIEGIPIRKPINSSRRLLNNTISVASNQIASNSTANHLQAQSSNTHFGVNRYSNKATSIYSQSLNSRSTKANIRGNNTGNNTASRTNNMKITEVSNRSTRLLAERSRSPVKIRMQNTMKRLSTEASNIPSKPNAFNLPKQSHSSTSVTSNGSNTTVSTFASQTSLTKLPTNKNQQTVSQFTMRLPPGVDNQTASNTNATVHFVSSSQAKAASSMGIMHIGSAYNGIIAAANRGCFPGKSYQMPYPSPQTVLPKSFPVSSIAGGEVLAGGGPMIHPPPPPGMVAVTPQTIGLGLPFQKYFAMNQLEHGTELSQQRKPISYAAPDFRLGVAARTRVSGIHEWLRKQQSDSGLSVCCYYQSNDECLAIDSSTSGKPKCVTSQSGATFEDVSYSDDGLPVKEISCDCSSTRLLKNSSLTYSKCDGDTGNVCRPTVKPRLPKQHPHSCPFTSSFYSEPKFLLDNTRRPKSILQTSKKKIRSFTTENYCNKTLTSLYISKIFSVKYRQKHSLAQKGCNSLAISSNVPVSS